MRHPESAESTQSDPSHARRSVDQKYVMFVRSRSKNVFDIIVYSYIILNQWASVGADYCNLQSCGSNPHTMCRYPDSGPSSNCNQYDAPPLTASEKNALVEKHNQYRRKVAAGLEKRGHPGPQPKAIGMTMLTWDDELANVAQRWADQCMNGHDKCRNVDRFTVGQNIATSWSSAKITKKIESLCDGWYNEVKFFSKYHVDSYVFGMKWGHYTQVVWAESLTVGCGRVFFWDAGRHMHTLRLVCNYGPAGNFLNHPVYISSAHRTNFNLIVSLAVILCFFKIR